MNAVLFFKHSAESSFQQSQRALNLFLSKLSQDLFEFCFGFLRLFFCFQPAEVLIPRVASDDMFYYLCLARSIGDGIGATADGENMLVATNGNALYVVDAYECTVLRVLSSFNNLDGRALEPSYSPDGRFVTCGSSDGTVHTWEVSSGVETDWR